MKERGTMEMKLQVRAGNCVDDGKWLHRSPEEEERKQWKLMMAMSYMTPKKTGSGPFFHTAVCSPVFKLLGRLQNFFFFFISFFFFIYK